MLANTYHSYFIFEKWQSHFHPYKKAQRKKSRYPSVYCNWSFPSGSFKLVAEFLYLLLMLSLEKLAYQKLKKIIIKK